MSLELVREVSRENPDLLATNLGRTCYRHTLLLVEKLRARGHDAHLMCKGPGEGQYIPPGFQARTVTGLDGKVYPCTGVSHDAIWCDHKQFDTLGSANEHDQAIYRKSTPPFWSFDPADGEQITASPTWVEIPRQQWRNNNPPLRDGAPLPVPVPPSPTPAPPVATFPYPDENTSGKAFQVRVRQAYEAANRRFPDPFDEEAFRHFMRYGYSCRSMPEAEAADKHIAELRRDLGL